MSTATLPPIDPSPVPTSSVPAARAEIVVQDQLIIPSWVNDLESFRSWIRSDTFSCNGWVSYLNGEIWVDLSMEELFTHNQVKSAYSYSIMHLLAIDPVGLFVADRMLLTNAGANLSSEPDGSFYFWETFQSGRLQLVAGADGFTEMSGTPDMVLEVVSKYSIRKDTVLLRELYWKAGIPEFWLVDARGAEPRFEILRHTERDYVAVEPADGWVTSSVFQRRFQIVKQTNPLGQPQFVVEVKT